MTALGWTIASLGLLLGVIVGWFIARVIYSPYFVFQGVSYDCLKREITGQVIGPAPFPTRIYAHVWTGDGGAVPAVALSVPWSTEEGYFTIHDPGWPNTGTIYFRVWGGDVMADGFEHCGSGGGSGSGSNLGGGGGAAAWAGGGPIQHAMPRFLDLSLPDDPDARRPLEDGVFENALLGPSIRLAFDAATGDSSSPVWMGLGKKGEHWTLCVKRDDDGLGAELVRTRAGSPEETRRWTASAWNPLGQNQFNAAEGLELPAVLIRPA